MNTTIRNACFAIAAVGALSLTACQTSGDSMDEPTTTPESAPMEQSAPATDSTMPTTDPTGDPATEAPTTGTLTTP